LTIEHSTESQLKKHGDRNEEIIHFFQEDMMMSLRSPRQMQVDKTKNSHKRSMTLPSVFESVLKTQNTSQGA
jgi:hypothetical protein